MYSTTGITAIVIERSRKEPAKSMLCFDAFVYQSC